MRRLNVVHGFDKKTLLDWFGESREVPFCVVGEDPRKQFQIRLDIRSLEMGNGSDESFYLTGYYKAPSGSRRKFMAYYHTKKRTGVIDLWREQRPQNPSPKQEIQGDHHGVLLE